MNNPLQSQFRRCAAAAAFAALAAASGSAWAQADDAIRKDLHILQAPMLDIEPAPAAASAANAGAGDGLAVSATVDRADGLYEHGDTLTLTVETTEDAYVWVFDTGTSGKVHQIFPNLYADNNFVRKDSPVAIPGPGAEYEFAVSRPSGPELLTVIASRDSAPLAQELVAEETGSGPFLPLRGTATSVAKDLSVSLRERHPTWARDHRLIKIR